MKRLRFGLFSVFALLAAYLLIRYPLFHLHGMNQFPLILFCTAAVLVIAGCIFKGRFAAFFTVLGYAVGFFCGYFFQVESNDPGGGRLTNLWCIWACCVVGAFFAGVLADLVFRFVKKGQNQTQ